MQQQSKGKRTYQEYDVRTRELAVKRVKVDQLSVREVADSLDVPPTTVFNWVKKKEANPEEPLIKKHGGGRQPKLSGAFQLNVVKPWLLERQANKQHTQWGDLSSFLHSEYGITASPALLSRYGANLGFRSLRAIPYCDASPSDPTLLHTAQLWNSYLNNNFEEFKKAFIDEKNVHSNQIPTNTIAKVGTKAFVDKGTCASGTYAERLDMINSCIQPNSPHESGYACPPVIFTAADRKKKGVKGINSAMFEEYLEDHYFPAINHRDERVVTILDNARIHRKSVLYDLFFDKCPDTHVTLLFLPPYTAKYTSPLDNGFHAELDRKYRKLLVEEKDRKTETVLKALKKAFIQADHSWIQYYRHCGIN